MLFNAVLLGLRLKTLKITNCVVKFLCHNKLVRQSHIFTFTVIITVVCLNSQSIKDRLYQTKTDFKQIGKNTVIKFD